MRVEIIDSENVKLPASAISAGQVNAAEPGRRQTITPTKADDHRGPAPPADRLAEHAPAMAVTKIGPAR